MIKKKLVTKKLSLEEKYKGKEVKPTHKGYWKLPSNRENKRKLIIDGVRYTNLGAGCEETLMFHFDGDSPTKWEIAKHFTLCK